MKRMKGITDRYVQVLTIISQFVCSYLTKISGSVKLHIGDSLGKPQKGHHA